ncbi:MAG: hypothetical protein JNM26_02030 [Ideonella sp.]|nr:hypothetical protein [Ideonella sp.]
MSSPVPELPTYGGGHWAGMRALLATDYQRLLATMQSDTRSLLRRAFWFLLPHFLGIALYRLSHWAYANDWRNLARLIFMVNLYVTRMEITPQTVIGPGLLIGHATGVTLDGHIGERCTVMGMCNTGGGFGDKNLGAGAGLPRIGDDVTIGYGAMVLGGIHIGDGARIGPGAIVTSDVPAGSLVMWTMPRIMPGRAPGAANAPGA